MDDFTKLDEQIQNISKSFAKIEGQQAKAVALMTDELETMSHVFEAGGHILRKGGNRVENSLEFFGQMSEALQERTLRLKLRRGQEPPIDVEKSLAIIMDDEADDWQEITDSEDQRRNRNLPETPGGLKLGQLFSLEGNDGKVEKARLVGIGRRGVTLKWED